MKNNMFDEESINTFTFAKSDEEYIEPNNSVSIMLDSGLILFCENDEAIIGERKLKDIDQHYLLFLIERKKFFIFQQSNVDELDNMNLVNPEKISAIEYKLNK